MRIKTIFFLAAIASASVTHAEWPVDEEPYGFLGCKQLRFRGFWENNIDSANLEESTDGICITVALANIMLYYRWPEGSHFDGIFISGDYNHIVKRIKHRWNYDLIVGPKTTADCDSDDPHARIHADYPGWTGTHEIRHLIYAVERSFGYAHEYFKTIDTNACDGEGYYAIEHVLRNRFGYPLCKTIDAKTAHGKRAAIRNLKNNMPVIAMKCDHAFLLDGYRYDTKRGRALIHSSDYLQMDASMGWFPWKYFDNEALDRFVINISPEYRLSSGPSSGKISYYWGTGYIPATSNTMRKGRIIIRRSGNLPVGSIVAVLKAQDMSDYAAGNVDCLYHFKGRIDKNIMLIPDEGFFFFDVGNTTRIDLSISNYDKAAKSLTIVFQDFVREKT
jgi:hypothetical protein